MKKASKYFLHKEIANSQVLKPHFYTNRLSGIFLINIEKIQFNYLQAVYVFRVNNIKFIIKSIF